MKKLLLTLLVMPFLITACDISRSLPSTSATTTDDPFYTALDAYIANVGTQNVCINLDELAGLQALAKAQGHDATLRTLGVGRLLLDSYVANVDLADVAKKFNTLVKADSANKTNTSTFNKYIVVFFGDCAGDDPAKFEALKSVVEELYITFTSTIISGLGNSSLGDISGDDFLKTAGCIQEFDQYIKAAVFPFIDSLQGSDVVSTQRKAFDKEYPQSDCVSGIFDSITGIFNQ